MYKKTKPQVWGFDRTIRGPLKTSKRDGYSKKRCLTMGDKISHINSEDIPLSNYLLWCLIERVVQSR